MQGAQPGSGQITTPVPSHAAATLLIVDDSPENLSILGGLLQPLYHIRAANSGERALRAVRNGPPPDLILLDIMMPGMDGYEVLAQLRADPATADIPVIFITAMTEVRDELKGFELGAADYIHKPIQGAIVLSRVRVQLEAKAARDMLKKNNARLVHQVEAGSHALEEAQLQLLHSERLAAIGQLAAGVAHEINNPVGYVGSNLTTLQSYLDDLFRLIDTYEQNPAAAAAVRQEVDIAFLRQDIATMLAESQEGIGRVRQIARDLKDFSRAGKDEWVYADLLHGIDSTLNIVWNELKYDCRVDKQYGSLPSFPHVRCLPSQLNQVFLNLLVNAGHAIRARREREPGHAGVIEIAAAAPADGTVVLRFADNGSGIEPEVLEHIFEAFYTTKPAGQGTGLGLSLTQEIIARHHGHIEVSSTPGVGTTFTLILPLEGPSETAAESVS